MTRPATLLAAVAAAALLRGCHVPAEEAFKAQKSAKKTVTLVRLKSLSAALEGFRIHGGRYPTTEEGLAALAQPPAEPATAARWAGPYLNVSAGQASDAWDRPMHYERLPGGPERYRAWSDGADGAGGTADDVSVTGP